MERGTNWVDSSYFNNYCLLKFRLIILEWEQFSSITINKLLLFFFLLLNLFYSLIIKSVGRFDGVFMCSVAGNSDIFHIIGITVLLSKCRLKILLVAMVIAASKIFIVFHLFAISSQSFARMYWQKIVYENSCNSLMICLAIVNIL